MAQLPKTMASAAALLALSTATAAADTVHGTRSEKLVERAHRIALSIEPGLAELTVRRTVYNGGPRHDQAVLGIDVPEGAVATGLRTLGLLEGKPHWFRGELMEAGAAADKYRELTGISGYQWVKDPALLSWSHQRQLWLQVFPVAPGGPKTIEYTLALPTEYRDGRYAVTLPAMGTEKLLATLAARDAPAAGRLLVDGKQLEPGARFSPPDDEGVEVALEPRRTPRIGGALAVVPLATDRALTRLRVEAGRELSAVPREARVVVVLDRSRSIRGSAMAAQATAARAYLSHFQSVDGKARVLTFDRRVRALQDRFVAPARAMADLAKLGAETHNGSQVDDALIEAERVLAAVPAHLPKRILLLTDARTRTSLTEQGIRGAIGSSGAIVHVGEVTDGAPTLDRYDEHRWTSAIRLTGGVAWSAMADGDSTATLDADHRSAFEEWVRPVRLHHFRVSATGAPDGQLSFDRSLAEGQGVTAGWIASAEVPWARVDAELWASPVSHVLRPDPAEGKRWSALVFGSPLFWDLDESELLPLAMKGGAVTPVTSYLAIEPGVRPSTEGLDHERGGRGEGIGLGSIGTIGHGGGWGRSPFDYSGHLQRHLEAAWKRCGGPKRTSIIVKLETTLAEIVDVKTFGTQVDPPRAAAACLTEAAWQHHLPAPFWHEPLQTWTIRLPRGQ
ncbi:MAG: VWA domain-containing protein [Deltaproteobacteria bacterium]|jgi:hypothetical protein|nr:VWA domain-containing protein [Deltaproteobacteria bacterium]MBW2529902.1 VWA domain-containing protein [Deltaproteobacteria bacterium]